MRYEENVKIFTQLVCMNGHQIDVFSKSNDDPNPPSYCELCGEKSICTCQHCHTPIDGKRQYPNVADLTRVAVPSYCRACGNPYPWTEIILESAVEMVGLDTELSESERQTIKSALPDLLVDTPKTKLQASKFKIVMSKATGIVKDGMRELLVDVISETAKKMIYPN